MLIAAVVVAVVATACVELFGTVSYNELTSNYTICSQHYPIGVEFVICNILGGKYTAMRDDLILRKANGENIYYRHFGTWADSKSWMTATVSPAVSFISDITAASLTAGCAERGHV